jgi:hypothetical protein
MPKIIAQPDDLGDFPRLNDEQAARRKVRAGHRKWQELRNQIEHVRIGSRRFWTDSALVAYLRRQTHKPRSRRDEEQRPSS